MLLEVETLIVCIFYYFFHLMKYVFRTFSHFSSIIFINIFVHIMIINLILFVVVNVQSE